MTEPSLEAIKTQILFCVFDPLSKQSQALAGSPEPDFFHLSLFLPSFDVTRIFAPYSQNSTPEERFLQAP
ncbi:hypothetical protein [Kiloniella laminariae]|uniref:hypothetical protein n=1 Tax=Kiloniella laminariae TaxID=454162 RepID=UPI0003789CE8|nr:hypothetical protein [Kiloniella laminariae]